MSALYSKAFDHLGPQNENDSDYTYQDPEFVVDKNSFRRSGGAGGRSSAFRIKERNIIGEITADDDMGQGQSSSQYIDVFDDARSHRVPPHQRNLALHRESEPVIRRGHHNEDSEEYCYAYTDGVSHDNDITFRHTSPPPPPQRSVSLRDDYSQPLDRLSSSGSTQDYIEPYQSTGSKPNPVSKFVPPDPGGIYQLAKEVDEIREAGPPNRQTRSVASDHYNHLNDVQSNLSKASIQDRNNAEERYDHVQSWSSRMKPLPSTDSGTEHYVSAESSPLRKCSNVSDDVFAIGTAMSKVSTNVYRDLPANYEEPWDSEHGQKKFDRLMSRAERKHESRQSFDQASQEMPRKSVDRSGNRLNSAAEKKPAKQSGKTDIYEAAWAGSANPSKRSPAPISSPIPPQHKPHVISNYEDAWDLPEKQREFEEKLLQARKSRASQGQIREEETTSTEERSVPKFSPSAINQQRAEPGTFFRSDSCRTLAALAESIDKSIPLEDQSFYHGAIKRSAAERTLLVFKEGSYLIRRSETSKKDFSLTLKGWNGKPMHMKIACKPDGTYILGEHSPPFNTIPEMVDYYTTHELPVQNADRICLLYPIPC